MARYEHLPIYKSAMDLALEMEKTVRNMSRYLYKSQFNWNYLKQRREKEMNTNKKIGWIGFFLCASLLGAPYTDSGIGTITDSATGLIWQKCSVGQKNDKRCY